MPEGSVTPDIRRLIRAVGAYDAKMAEYDAPGYDGVRLGFGAIRHELIQAARAVAHERAR